MIVWHLQRYHVYKSHTDSGPGSNLMGAHTLIGDDVYNHKGADQGDVK